MKKQILCFITALLLALLLSACTNTDGDKDTSDRGEPAFSLPLPTLDDDNNADTPDEGNVPEYGYLADAKFDTDETLPEYDIPVSYVGDYTFRQLYSYGDKLYTYTATDTFDGFITVTDKDSYESAPLCTVAECRHTGEGCEAYIYGAVYGFRVYDGMLYWVQGIYDISSAISLVRCNLDGTGREIVWSYDNLNNELGVNFITFFRDITGSFNVFIHRGYIYFAGVSQTNSIVACMPLSGGEPVILATPSTLGATGRNENVACRIRPVNNDIYVMMNRKLRSEETSEFGYSNRVLFYRIDTKTREISELGWTESAMLQRAARSYDENAFVVVPGDGIYFIELYEYYINDETWSDCDSTATLCRLSFDTGEIEHIAKLCDGDFDSFFHVGFAYPPEGKPVVEAHSMGNMYVFDLEGSLVSKREFMTEYDYPRVDIIGAGSDEIYFACEAGGNRFFVSTPIDGIGVMNEFTAYAIEEQYVDIDDSAGLRGYATEVIAPTEEYGDLEAELSFGLRHVNGYVIADPSIDYETKITYYPFVLTPVGGAAYVRTNHGFEETVDEVRCCCTYGVTLEKLPHMMQRTGRYADFSFYFYDSKIVSLRFCQSFD